MPKKSSTNYRPDMLRSLVDRLERLAGRMRAVADVMEQDGVEELSITYHSSMVQGLGYAEAFGQAAERAWDNHRLGEPDEAQEGG